MESKARCLLKESNLEQHLVKKLVEYGDVSTVRFLQGDKKITLVTRDICSDDLDQEYSHIKFIELTSELKSEIAQMEPMFLEAIKNFFVRELSGEKGRIYRCH